MFFVFRQRLVVDTVAGDVNFFRTPEEGELFFDQLFEDVIFLLIVTGDVNRLAKNIGSSSWLFFVCEKVVYAMSGDPVLELYAGWRFANPAYNRP